MRKSAILLLFLVLSTVTAPARDAERGVLALDQALRDIASDLRAMMIVVRPGNEDLDTLAFLRRGLGIRTRVVYLTRGESSSRMPGEADERAEGDRHAAEAREATACVGAEARFLGFPDFGPTRSTQEVWGRWGGSDAARALVAAIREFRPHLVLTSLPGSVDSAYEEVARGFVREAWEAASDPGQFPGEGPVFKPQRLFAASVPGQATVRLDVGRQDPVRGATFAEMGVAARRWYRAGREEISGALAPDPRFRHYRLVLTEGSQGGDDLLAGIVMPRPEWLVEESRSGTRAEVVSRLLRLRAKEDGSAVSPLRIGNAVAATVGLDLRIRTPAEGFVEDETGEVQIELVNMGTRAVKLESLRVAADPGLLPDDVEMKPFGLDPGRTFVASVAVAAASIGEHALRATVLFRLDTGEGLFALTRRAVLPVRLALEGRIRPWDRLIRPVAGPTIVGLEIENRSSRDLEGEVIVSVEGEDALNIEAPEKIRVRAGVREVFPVTVEASDPEASGLFQVTFRIGAFVVKDVLRLIDVEVPEDLTIGVVAAAGDAEIRALEAMRAPLKVLSDDDLELPQVANLATILVGEGEFHRRPALRRAWPRLLEFVEDGGNLVLMSGPREGWEPAMGPSPITFDEEWVTEEGASMVVSEHNHRLIRFPTPILDDDWQGWVRERGSHFPEGFSDSDYLTVLRVADTGRSLVPALIVAQRGRGSFIQTSLSLRLQLANLNPAALKLLANMISYPFGR